MGAPSGSGLTNTAVDLKDAAAVVEGYFLDNTENTLTTFFQFFNSPAAKVNVGTTVPLYSFAVPGGASANLSGLKLPFSAGLSIAATTTYGGSTAPANAVSYNVFFK
jgi:hypothetical protein